MIECIIIDDEPRAIEVIACFIEKTVGLALVGTETDPMLGLEKILKGEYNAQIVFLDLQMPQIDGVTFAQKVMHLIDIVFVTGNQLKGKDGFEVNAIDYLVKPVQYSRFLLCVLKINERMLVKEELSKRRLGKIRLKSGVRNQVDFVETREIIYVKGDGNLSLIHTVDGMKKLYNHQLNEMEEKLAGTNFMKVHRSFIINLNYVVSVNGKMIKMKGEHFIQISDTYKTAFDKWINL